MDLPKQNRPRRAAHEGHFRERLPSSLLPFLVKEKTATRSRAGFSVVFQGMDLNGRGTGTGIDPLLQVMLQMGVLCCTGFLGAVQTKAGWPKPAAVILEILAALSLKELLLDGFTQTEPTQKSCP